jgi:hypothetical protein
MEQIETRISELASDMVGILSGYLQYHGYDIATEEYLRNHMDDQQIVARYLWTLRKKPPFQQYLDSLTLESTAPGQ